MDKTNISDTVNVEKGVIFAFFALLSYPLAKIKLICLFEGNRSSIVKIVLPTF